MFYCENFRNQDPKCLRTINKKRDEFVKKLSRELTGTSRHLQGLEEPLVCRPVVLGPSKDSVSKAWCVVF